MTKKKPVSKKKPVTKKRPVSTKPKTVVKEITMVDEKGKDGYWTRTTVVKYAKQLMCPAFLNDKIILYSVAIPLLIMILVVLWRIFNYE